MRANREVVKQSTKEQILNEYALILLKRSKLSRDLRDRVVAKALVLIEQDQRKK